MKNKIVYLFMVLFLVSCGSSTTSSLAPDSPKGLSSPKVTVQSILSDMEKGRYKEGEVLVKFKSGTVASASLKTHQAVGATSLRKYTIVPNMEHLKLPEGLSVKDAIIHYMSDPNVEYAEPNYLKVMNGMPNDTSFGNQWALHNTGQYASGTAGADIRAPLAWDFAIGSHAITIAVIDSGIDYNHPDLVNNIWSNTGESCTDGIDHDGNGYINDCRGWNFVSDNKTPVDDLGHGTHVAGIIGAAGNNWLGVAGVMWHVKLMPLKVLNSSGSGTTSDVVSAIQYAVSKGVKIINASYGGFSYSQAEYNAISSANSQGVLFVASAGNGDPVACGELGKCIGVNNDLTPMYPASYNLPNIISVAATDQNDKLASFSNFGFNSVDVAAPGVYILSTIPMSGTSQPFLSFCTNSLAVDYDFCGGTSQAAPHVSGVAGLLFGQYPHLSLHEVRGTILSYVDVLPSLNSWISTGGRINAFKAVFSLRYPTNLSATTLSSGEISLAWTDNAVGEAGYKVERRAPGGDFVQIAALGPDSSTYSDHGLAASTTYTYRVKAFNSVPVDTTYSNNASATTLAPDAPPPPSSSNGGGSGGCSIGARQNTSTAMADLGVLLMPLLLIAILRRRR